MEGSDGRKTTATEHAAALRALAGHKLLRSEGGQPSQAFSEAVAVFGSERELVLAAHQRWQVTLLARLDQVLELNAGDVHADVLGAVEQLGRSMPGLAALLREHAEDPALDRARGRLAAYVDQACPCGRAHPLVPAPSRMRSPSRCAVAARLRRSILLIAAHLRAEHCGRRPRSAALVS